MDQPIHHEEAHYYGAASVIPAEIDHQQRVDSNQYVSSPKEYPTAENPMVQKQPLNQEMMTEQFKENHHPRSLVNMDQLALGFVNPDQMMAFEQLEGP